MEPGRFRRASALIATTSLLSVAVAACGSSSEDDSGAFTIYMSVDKSGPTKSYSEAEIGGMEVAIDQLNKDGGIDGREIKLETVDDANNPTKAVNLLQQRLSKGGKPDLVFPGGSSAVTMSMLPVLTRNKIASMSTTSASTIDDPEKFPYHFGVVTTTDAYIPPMLAEAEKNGYKKVAMLHATDTSGQAAVEHYQDAFDEAGIELVEAGYDVAALDMTPELSKLKASNPDALIVSGYGTAALYAFKSRAKLGWEIPTYADQLSSTFPLASSMPANELKNVKVVIGSTSLASAPDFPAIDTMVAEVKKGDYADSLPKTGVAVYMVGYDIPMLYAAAEKQAKSTEAEKVAKALEDLDVDNADVTLLQPGPDGDKVSYDYSGEDHFPTSSDGTLQYVAPGTNNADGFYVPGS